MQVHITSYLKQTMYLPKIFQVHHVPFLILSPYEAPILKYNRIPLSPFPLSLCWSHGDGHVPACLLADLCYCYKIVWGASTCPQATERKLICLLSLSGSSHTRRVWHTSLPLGASPTPLPGQSCCLRDTTVGRGWRIPGTQPSRAGRQAGRCE